MRHPHTLRRTPARRRDRRSLAQPRWRAAPAGAAPVVKPIVFPVDGTVTYTDTFGACRDGCARTHEGQDLMGKKMLPLLAAVDGVVHRVMFNNTSSGGNSVTIKAADGWTYHYLHVNNDTPGTDDGQATRAQAFPDRTSCSAPRCGAARWSATWATPATPRAPARTSTSRSASPPPPGGYTGTPINAYESLRQATGLEHRLGLGPPPHGDRRARPTSSFTYGVQTGRPRPALRLGRRRRRRGRDLPHRHLAPARRHQQRRHRPPDRRSAPPSDTPLCGDVDGDGADEPVLFRAGTWTVRGRASRPATRSAWTARYGVARRRPAGARRLGRRRRRRPRRSTAAAPGTSAARAPPAGAHRRHLRLRVAAGRPARGRRLGRRRRRRRRPSSAGGEWHLRSSAQAPAARTVTSFRFGAAGGQPLVGHGVRPRRCRASAPSARGPPEPPTGGAGPWRCG